MNFKNIIKSTGIYFLGNVLSKIIVFLMLPIYTSRVPPADMGLYDTGTTIITLFASMLFLDIGSVILKYALEKGDNSQPSAITNGTVILLASSGLYLALLAVVGIFFEYEYFAYIVVYGLLYALNSAVGYIARAMHCNTDYAVSGVIQTLLNVLLNILMLVYMNVDYKSLYVSFTLSSLAATLYLIFKTGMLKQFKSEYFDKSKFSDMLKFSLPLCVNSLAFWLLSSSGRVIVTYVLGSEYTGFLSVANKFTQIVYLISTCVHLTWQEVAFSHDNGDRGEDVFYEKVFTVCYKVVAVCIVLLIPAVRVGLYLFPSFIDAEYSQSINHVPMALIGTGLAVVSQFLGTILTSLKKTKMIFASTMAGAVTTVVTTFFFIKVGCGAESANLSFACGFIINVLIRVVFMNRCISFKCGALNLCLLVPMLAFAVLIYVYTDAVWNIVFAAVALCLIPLLFRKEFKSYRGKLNERKR